MGLEEKPIGKAETSGKENILVVPLIRAHGFPKNS